MYIFAIGKKDCKTGVAPRPSASGLDVYQDSLNKP